MKKLIFIFLCTIGICFAQFIGHTATISTSLDSVRSDEVFTVTYTLTDIPPNRVYIAMRADDWEFVGDNKWEGNISENESIIVKFQVKLKESTIREYVPVSVGFSYSPFINGELYQGQYKSTTIKIIDYSEIKIGRLRKVEERKKLKKADEVYESYELNKDDPFHELYKKQHYIPVPDSGKTNKF